MKNFAIIINFEGKQCILAKTQTRTLASSRFEALCKSVIVCRRPLGSLRRYGGRMERHSFSPMRHRQITAPYLFLQISFWSQ